MIIQRDDEGRLRVRGGDSPLLSTYLESDLNPGGVASVSKEVESISSGAASVNEKITSIVSELERIASQIAATKPPPEQPAETQETQPEK